MRERYLVPAFSLLILLPFLLTPELNRWKESLPVCSGTGSSGIGSLIIPESTLFWWAVIDLIKDFLYIGAAIGALGLAYLIGKTVEVIGCTTKRQDG
ncbi:hypothetical protein Theam_1758 (plasmid) [Thermovibrio ammonificans HB-1]|uniref:Uncharacterized protein n=1 Tax=Thermovibrio ammonificans (strain DSM 15698 / JCM 12110 / HB-1) TaxID=648996 RepID=E8T6Z3_THEA1|nr:hypothetical protein [Thermovibrio ammonificans]ADU97714.1 hypothetical protein Theam_1758 [Thermovibrio ammonificans HB-1]